MTHYHDCAAVHNGTTCPGCSGTGVAACAKTPCDRPPVTGRRDHMAGAMSLIPIGMPIWGRAERIEKGFGLGDEADPKGAQRFVLSYVDGRAYTVGYARA